MDYVLLRNTIIKDYELSYFTFKQKTGSSIKAVDGQYGNTKVKSAQDFINWYLSFSSDKNKDLELINNFRKKMINGNPHQYVLSNNKLVINHILFFIYNDNIISLFL